MNLTADGSVKDAVPQTRAENELFRVPELSEFNIHLKRADGTTHKHCPHDKFVEDIKSETFPTGAYTLTAYAGDLMTEGFDCPYLEGTTSLTVLEADEAVAQVNAKVGNTLVSVDYTDNFKKYMKSYAATVHSDGYSYIDIPAGETRPAFLVPGEVSLALEFTNQQGQSLKLQPADFPALAAHHYHVTMDVNEGNVGVATLQIKFDNLIESEDVYIDLTDELFTAPAPKVTLKGLEVQEGVTPELEFLSGEAPEGEYRFNVVSHAGMKAVNLTIKGYESSLIKGDINLIGASEAVQSELASLGIDCKGLFKNPDRMAFIDFSNLPKHLKAGNYEVSVAAIDMVGRMSEVASVKINCVAPTVNVSPVAAYSVINEGEMIVNYNGSNPMADLTFKARNQYGMYEEAPIISCEKYTGTRASIEGVDYLIKVQLPEFGSRETEPVDVYLRNVLVNHVELPVIRPITFQADGFSHRVLIKVDGPADEIAGAVSNVTVSYNGSEITTGITRDQATGIIEITGLNPDTEYTYTFAGFNQKGDVRTVTFTTEKETPVPNGDFSDFSNTIEMERLNAGGKYDYSFTIFNGTYQNYIPITVATPAGWGNINDETFYMASTNQNTWYMVPSTLEENQKVTVRTVGYSHNGPELPNYKTNINNFYSQNSPARSDLSVAAGQLFLGEKAGEGIAFSSRPAEVEFVYEYAPMGSETALAKVTVYSGSEIIGSGSVNVGSGSGTGKIPVQYIKDVFGKKATSLSIVFYSSSAAAPDIYIPTKTELKDNDQRTSPDAINGGSKLTYYKSLAVGSVLTLDNVKLNY